MDYKSLAKKIFDITGPEENILHAANCMTRLRLQLAQAAPETAAVFFPSAVIMLFLRSSDSALHSDQAPHVCRSYNHNSQPPRS